MIQHVSVQYRGFEVCLHFHKKLTVKISLNIDFKVVNVDLAVEVNFTFASLHLCIGHITNYKTSQEVKSSILKDHQATSTPHKDTQQLLNFEDEVLGLSDIMPED